MGLAGEREAHHGAAVEAVFEADHGGAAGVAAGDLDRVLDRLGAGVDEEGLLGEVAGGERVELLGELDVALVSGDLEAHVQEGVELAADGGDDARVAMADVDAADASAEVDEAVAVEIFKGRALGGADEDGGAGVDSARDGGGAAVEPGFGFGAGEFGLDLDGGHGGFPMLAL